MAAKEKRDYTISFVRMLAMISIVTCHVMQYYDMELAWWFNVGVQIFLCISGYLYGMKRIPNILAFYRKNFIKILVDYEIVIVAALAATILFTDIALTTSTVIGVLLTVTTMEGGAHLWFISTILMCYLLTPLYERVCRWTEQKHSVLFFVSAALLFVLNEWLFRQQTDYFNAAWINCYLIGFILRRLQQNHHICYNLSVPAMMAAGALFIAVQISVRYLQLFTVPDALWPLYYAVCDYGHVFLGVTIFCIGRVLLRPICKLKPVQWILRLSDQYSYQIYLTHHFFILGPFTLMALTDDIRVNMAIILMATIVTAVLVQKLSAGITRERRGKHRKALYAK